MVDSSSADVIIVAAGDGDEAATDIVGCEEWLNMSS